MAIKLPFKNFNEKFEYLNNLYYNVGNQLSDFELSYMDKEKDIQSKWRKWSIIGFDVENKENKKWVKLGNNRTILKNEVVLDLEEADRYEEILEKLKSQGLSFRAFKTGSMGYHFHLLFRGDVSPEDKLKIIECYDCDTQKSSERCMIALEFVPHWKTGKPKELIEENEGELNYVEEILSKNNYKEIKEEDVKPDAYIVGEDGNTLLTKESLKQKLIKLVDLDEIDKEDELKSLAKISNAKITTLRKQLVNLIKNKKDKYTSESDTEGKEEEPQKYSNEEMKEAIEFFDNKNILKKIQDEITKDHLGDDNLKMTLFLAELSGLLNNPKLRISCAIKGNSSSGKDNAIRSTLKHIPEDKFIFVTNITQAVMEDDIKGKNILTLSEMNAEKDDGANKHLIEAIKQRTEGGMSSSKKDLRDGMKTARHEVSEQGTVIYSTTESEMDEEMKTRFICLDMSSTSEKIKAVNDNTLDNFSNIDSILGDKIEKTSKIRIFLTGFSRVFEGFSVLIPYAKYLKDFSFISDDDPRSQRDLKRILALTSVMTFLNFTRRKRYQKKGVNFVESEPKDLIDTLSISKNFFNQSYTGMDARLSKILNFIKNENEEWVERGKIQEKFGIKSLNTLKDYLNELSLSGLGLIEGCNGGRLNERQAISQYHSSKIYYKTCQKAVKKPFITCQLSELEEYLYNKIEEDKKNKGIEIEKDTTYKHISGNFDTFLLTPFKDLKNITSEEDELGDIGDVSPCDPQDKNKDEIDKKSGNLGNIGNLSPRPTCGEKDLYIEAK